MAVKFGRNDKIATHARLVVIVVIVAEAKEVRSGHETFLAFRGGIPVGFRRVGRILPGRRHALHARLAVVDNVVRPHKAVNFAFAVLSSHAFLL